MREGGCIITAIFPLGTKGDSWDKLLVRVYEENIDYSEWLEMIGNWIIIDDYVKLPEPAANPKTFDYRKYLLSKGIKWFYETEKIGVEEKGYDIHNFHSAYLRIKKKVILLRYSFINSLFDEGSESKNLAEGILFGASESLDDEIYGTFQMMGTAHILAASGLHVGVFYAFYMGFFSLIKRKPKKTGYLVLMLILFVYGTAALWSASILRAIILVAIKVLAEILNKRFDMLSGVCVINISFLLVRPYMILNQGFQMSFLAAYGISILAPRLRGKVPDYLIVPIAVQGLIAIYSLWNYNAISLLSLIANVIMVFVGGIFVTVGIGVFIIYFVTDGRLLMDMEPVLSSLGNMMLYINNSLYGGGRWTVQVPSPKLFLVVSFIGIIIFLSSEFAMVLFKRSKKMGAICFSVTVIGLLIFGFRIDSSPFNKASQVFISVGQGDAYHISWENDVDILIDGGGRYNYDVGNNILKPYLLKNGVGDVDLAVTTHEHMDHFKGLSELKECYPISEILTRGVAGDIINVSEDRYIKILWPIPGNEYSEDENYYSRIFMVYDRGIRTLITGDITGEGEEALINEYEGTDELNCHILKVPHHGSRFSSSNRFIDETSPVVAVISVGKNNYGHPSPEVIEKFHDSGIIVYRTDTDGAVGVIVDEDCFTVCTQKSMRLEQYKRT